MSYENKINSFYAELPPDERKRIKGEVMELQGLKTDKTFHSQRYGKTEMPLLGALVWSNVLNLDVKILFVLK